MRTSTFTASASRRWALVAGVSLLVLASCSSEKSVSGASSTSSSSSVAETTTTVDPTTTLDATVTTLDATPTTMVADTTTTVVGPAPTAAPPAPPSGYTALGAPRLVGLSEEDHVFKANELACSDGMSFDYGEVDQCVEQDGLLVISYRIPEAKRVVEVYSLVGAFWVEVHQTTEDYDFEFTAVDLYLGDYAGIGYPAVFIGYRIDGTGHYLDFDIVQSEGEGPLDVRGIRGIDHGNVGLPSDEPGVVISAVYGASDPNCCPSSMLFQDLAYVGGAWSVTDGTLYPTASQPVWALAF